MRLIDSMAKNKLMHSARLIYLCTIDM